MKGFLEPTTQPLEDYESTVFRQIFSDTEKPFSDRLDKAVEFANRQIEIKIKFNHIIETYRRTGVLIINTENYEFTN